MKKKLSPVLIVAGVLNLFLFFIKLYVSIHTNSLSIYTDSINNLMDTLSLCLALFGVYFMCKSPTENFKHGFGKMEHITSFVMSIIMTVAGLSFAYTSLGRLMAPVPVWFFTKYAIIIGLTCFVKLLLGLIFTFRYKKIHSPILKTVMLDSYLDCTITIMTLVSFTLSNIIGFALDAILGLLISIIISIFGIRLIISSVSDLLGKSDGQFEEKVIDIIKEIDDSLIVNNISVHTYGEEKIYVALNLSLTDKNKDFMSVQNVIKNQLMTELNCNSTVEWEVLS